MILAGVAISSLFTGATTLIQYFSDDVVIATIVYWTFGSLGRAGWREITIIITISLIAFYTFLLTAGITTLWKVVCMQKSWCAC